MEVISCGGSDDVYMERSVSSRGWVNPRYPQQFEHIIEQNYVMCCSYGVISHTPLQLNAKKTEVLWFGSVAGAPQGGHSRQTSYYRHGCHPTSRGGPGSRSLLRFSSHNESACGPSCQGPTSTIFVVCDR